MSEADRRSRRVTVFGGTGFLGRRIVERLLAHGFAVRAAARHPQPVRVLAGAEADRVEPLKADINDEASVAAALEGGWGAVNAVSLYVESGGATFRRVHVEGAARLARLAREAGVARLVHISGIGADPGSRSSYIAARGRGEEAVRAEFPSATIVRPAVMFGSDDAFLTMLRRLVRLMPVLALFGRGETRLQPVHVGDVAEAVARILAREEEGGLYELGGPRVTTYAELVRTIRQRTGSRTLLMPMPFAFWRVTGAVAEFLPGPPLARTQVELMEHDNVAMGEAPGLAALGVEPTSLETVLDELERR
jgi:uncharacterized protein YbjT (DUF2867 family)